MAKLTHTGTHNNAAFGQYGAVYAHDADTAVIPPNGYIFCAITMLADTEFESLVSEDSVKGLDFVQNHTGKELSAPYPSLSLTKSSTGREGGSLLGRHGGSLHAAALITQSRSGR